MPKIWKINCMEKHYPGMWQRWFKSQCVAVGWASVWGYKLNGPTKGGRGWSQARRAIKEMEVGDYIIVALHGNKVGRLGEITGKAIEDDNWSPFVPPSKDLTDGEMGRRIFVRWDLTVGSDDHDMIVQLPDESTFTSGELRPTVSRIKSIPLNKLRALMNNPTNWVGLLAKFRYEKALSDYIVAYPHHIEDGLLPHPNSKIRERVFKDKTRLDVLLIDRDNIPVIVECKQHSPSKGDISQLRHYIKCLSDETTQNARGILVHGGAQKLRSEIKEEANKHPRVEIVNYRLEVNFTPSY